MIKLELTETEARMVVTALHAVSPVGGGSDVFTLARKIGGQIADQGVTGELYDVQLGLSLCWNVISEYIETEV